MRLPAADAILRNGKNHAAAAALASFLLAAPLSPDVASTLLPLPIGVPAASARELASGSGSKVNKDPNSLLRLGLPGIPKEMRTVQLKLEESEDQLSRLLVSNSNTAFKEAQKTLKAKSAAIQKAAPADAQDKAGTLLASLQGDVDSIGDALGANQVSKAQGSLKSALKTVSQIEELIASGYKIPVPPSEFTKELPYLNGRASVDLELKRPGGKFDVDGELYESVKVTTVLDGYTAPLTAGNFVDLVNKGFYNGFKIQRSDGFVVQTGDPTAEEGPTKGEKNGYVQNGKIRNVPLEVYVKGDKEPLYSMTFDDDSRGGYAATLPFNAYGALGMAREEYNMDSASSQWFWLLFDSDLTPAGKNLLDGRYACFGYTVDGARLLSDVKEGDVIVSAKVTAGLDKLVQPSP